MKKFVIITSIFPPTEAVAKFSKFKDWRLIVVGDKKTPGNWNYDNVTYLSPDDQIKLNYEIIKYLPWNSYSRKIIGYLYAIKEGADIIADTDDDNIPVKNWDKNIDFKGGFDTYTEKGFVNVYKFFTNEHVWPRGFPLRNILLDQNTVTVKKNNKVGIWQYLADGDPDVDAIYRLTNNKSIIFNSRSPIVLDKEVICPFNSQNTFFRKELFPLLYLPAFVTFRFTDILRGFVAQPLLWNQGYRLGFGQATVMQKRNPHDYLKDFESEIPCYLYAERIIEVVSASINNKDDLLINLLNAYKGLRKENIVTQQEINLLNIWISFFK